MIVQVRSGGWRQTCGSHLDTNVSFASSPIGHISSVGGGQKGSQCGGEAGAISAVEVCLERGSAHAPGRARLISWMPRFRVFALGAERFAFDLDDDRVLDEAIDERHGQGPVGGVFTPFLEVDVGDQGGGTLLIARGDRLAEQVGRFGHSSGSIRSNPNSSKIDKSGRP